MNCKINFIFLGFNNAFSKKELARVDRALLSKKFKTMTMIITARVGIWENIMLINTHLNKQNCVSPQLDPFPLLLGQKMKNGEQLDFLLSNNNSVQWRLPDNFQQQSWL